MIGQAVDGTGRERRQECLCHRRTIFAAQESANVIGCAELIDGGLAFDGTPGSFTTSSQVFTGLGIPGTCLGNTLTPLHDGVVTGRRL